MMKKTKIKRITSGERPLIDVWHYIVGKIRYYLWYKSKLKKILIRKHIAEQIAYRIQWMDRNCFYEGSCKICGCETTALQMCNKSCDKPCYPKMMTKKQWEIFKQGGVFKDGDKTWLKYFTTGRPLLFIETNNRYVPQQTLD